MPAMTHIYSFRSCTLPSCISTIESWTGSEPLEPSRVRYLNAQPGWCVGITNGSLCTNFCLCRWSTISSTRCSNPGRSCAGLKEGHTFQSNSQTAHTGSGTPKYEMLTMSTRGYVGFQSFHHWLGFARLLRNGRSTGNFYSTSTARLLLSPAAEFDRSLQHR